MAHGRVRGEDVPLVRVEGRVAPVHEERGRGAEADHLPRPDEVGRLARAERVLLLLSGDRPRWNAEHHAKQDEDGERAAHPPTIARGPRGAGHGSVRERSPEFGNPHRRSQPVRRARPGATLGARHNGCLTIQRLHSALDVVFATSDYHKWYTLDESETPVGRRVL